MSEEQYTMEKLQNALAEMEAIEENLGALAEQERLTSMVVEDYISSVEALKEIIESEDDTEILIPLGGTVMAKARLLSKENVLVGIGNGISVERTPSDGLEIVEKKGDELEKGLESLRSRMIDMDRRRREVAVYTQKAYAALQGQEMSRGAQ